MRIQKEAKMIRLLKKIPFQGTLIFMLIFLIMVIVLRFLSIGRITVCGQDFRAVIITGGSFVFLKFFQLFGNEH